MLPCGDAVLGTDHQMCVNACQAILWFHEYDLVPALIAAAEDDGHHNADLAAQTLLGVANLLYDELSTPGDYSRRRDPQIGAFRTRRPRWKLRYSGS